MNLEEARKKLIIMREYSEFESMDDALCDVIKFLLDEIERIKTPQLTVLEQLPVTPTTPISPPPSPDEPVRDYPSPHKSPPICDPIRKHRKDQNNAGDAI